MGSDFSFGGHNGSEKNASDYISVCGVWSTSPLYRVKMSYIVCRTELPVAYGNTVVQALNWEQHSIVYSEYTVYI